MTKSILSIRFFMKFFIAALAGLAFLLPNTASALDRSDCMKDPMWCGPLIRDNPKDIDLLLLRAAGYESQKNWIKAEEDYASAIELDPDDADLYVRKGIAEESMNMSFPAHDSYDHATKLDPNNVEYALLLARSFCSEEEFDGALKMGPRNADGFLMAGICSQRESATGETNLARAENLENRAIALKPDFAAAYYNRALLYVAKHDYRRALADLDSLERIDSGNADIYTLRGVIRGAQGDLGAAVREHGRAILADPLGAQRYLFRAVALLNSGQAASALADANRAVMLNPLPANAYQTRGKIREALGEKYSATADYQMAGMSDDLRAQFAKPSSGPAVAEDSHVMTWILVVTGVLGVAFFMLRGRKTAAIPPAA